MEDPGSRDPSTGCFFFNLEEANERMAKRLGVDTNLKQGLNTAVLLL